MRYTHHKENTATKKLKNKRKEKKKNQLSLYGPTSWLVHLEKLDLNVSNWWSVIRVNLSILIPSSLWCFSLSMNLRFSGFLQFKDNFTCG